MTIDDPKVFTKPFTINMDRLLAPDTELLEDVCENERDQTHMTGGSQIRLEPRIRSPSTPVFMSWRPDAR